MLSKSRIVVLGQTPYAHEREGLRHVEEVLPDTDPYQVWELADLVDPSTGRLYEIDMIVLGYSALYLLELKGGPGRYEGDDRDWYRTSPGETRRSYRAAPLSLANHKAKVLKSRMQQAMKDPRRAPRVEALVFLSARDLDLRLTPEGKVGVVTRETVLRALTRHEFPGSPANWRAERIDRPAAHDVVQALAAIGLRPRKGQAHVGPYELRDVIEEGPGYQDRAAVHRQHDNFRARARIYPIPEQTSVERRQQLLRAADREAQLLYELREHANVLRLAQYEPDAPMGPTVLFDDVPDALRLDAFLRENPNLSFGERIELVAQVGRALSFCHRKQIVHGGLGPHAVLVRRRPETGALHAHLYNFQLGGSAQVSGTIHWSSLSTEPWLVYQAPELREDPSRRSAVSDVFSLGALAYLVLTGKAPAESFVELDQRLEREGHLDPRTVDDSMVAGVAELIAEVTNRVPLRRTDDAALWVELLEQAATEPELEPAPEIDPLRAAGMDAMGDLVVERVLGQGATSRVLRVMRASDHRSFALKVSLSPEHDVRLEREARALSKLRHPRIVELVDERVVTARKCLLVSLAGERTLQQDLAAEGPVSLDYAARYGEDLLGALVELEEKQVLHRDIKPANLGVGSVGKGANHLMLFDFSLEGASTTDLGVGTTAYRDPFLRCRGAWDAAADRWSAAVTLHEMLTGVRPCYGGDGGTALDPESKLTLKAERFDAAVRGRLEAFFEKALARDAEQRHATAKDLLHAWIHAFEVPGSIHPAPDGTTGEAVVAGGARAWDARELTEAQLRAVGPDTPVEAMPLSPRARNALDRAGVTRASELLDLPANRLSAVRGVGRRVAQEIVIFRDRWTALGGSALENATPLFANYRGDDLLLAAAGVCPEVVEALRDAGIHALSMLASAPLQQVEHLAARAGFAVEPLRQLLDRESRSANERERPSTLEGWLEALLPRKGARAKYLAAYFGLAEPFLGRTDVRVREVAEHFALTPPAVYIALGDSRKRWARHPAAAELGAMVTTLLEDAGGAMSLESAAGATSRLLPHGAATEARTLRVQAAALVRIAAEVERANPRGFRLVMLRDDAPWVMEREDLAPWVVALGDEADALSERAVIVAPGEAARALGEVVAGSPFASLSADRLVELATAASRKAARSTRLEVYPQQMPAARAVELSSSALVGNLTPQVVRQRVAARYPDAEPLPDRPELDALLQKLGLHFDPQAGVYQRAGERVQATHTSASLTSYTALSTGQPRVMDDKAVTRQEFEDGIRAVIERRSLRVLGVTADASVRAARRLVERFGLRLRSFDDVFLKALHELLLRKNVNPDLVHEADRLGPGSPASWSNLLRVSNDAASEVAKHLFPPKEPLLLVQPGLIARYRLEAFLAALMEASKQDESRAIVMLVPSRDTGGVPRINGVLSIPGLLPQQAGWIPQVWLGKVREG